jgi:uncharacterized membrane protein YfcA
MISNYAINFLIVLVCVSLFDILYAQWNIALVAKKSVKAGIFASLTTAISGLVVVNYTEHHSLIVAAIIGSFIGTYIGTKIQKEET